MKRGRLTPQIPVEYAEVFATLRDYLNILLGRRPLTSDLLLSRRKVEELKYVLQMHGKVKHCKTSILPELLFCIFTSLEDGHASSRGHPVL